LGYNGARNFGSHEGREVALANTKSAIKRIRSSERKRQVNQVYRSRARTYVRRSRALIAAGELEEAEIMIRKAASALDRAAQKGVLHENNAARRKSRLVRQLNQAKQEAA
jgi:small subunit ribosomal protein S20